MSTAWRWTPDANLAVVTNARDGALPPDKWHHWQAGAGPYTGAFIGEGLVAGGLGRGADFAVEFSLAGAVAGGGLEERSR